MGFVRNIGGCRVNSIGLDLHQNADLSATIRLDKNGAEFPRKTWACFGSIEQAEEFIASFESSGAELVHKIKQHILSNQEIAEYDRIRREY